MIKEFAPAKVNLALHVTGQRDDGYHLLDSVVAFADVGDVVCLRKSDRFSLTINGPFGEGLTVDGDNLCLMAANLFGPNCPTHIHLTKNLPVASGIGGGSADAAAVLRGMSRLWDVALPDLDAQMALGADVPVCVKGVAARMIGAGEGVQPLQSLPRFAAVLVNPNRAVSTPVVFQALTQKNNAAIDDPAGGDAVAWLSTQRNDLQAPACDVQPVIADCIASISQAGAALSRMSGSGATCFGVFQDHAAAKEAAASIAQQNPNWWVAPVTLS